MKLDLELSEFGTPKLFVRKPLDPKKAAWMREEFKSVIDTLVNADQK